ncbi:MAG: RNA polymerase subunit sigma-24 [Anaerolinea sp.]|nr:RNA polymerase subunit sigma-24 [Anaerolinea sp.]
MDEQALIPDSQQGDLNAFNRLVLAYQDLAFNIAYRMLGDEARAEECTQEAFFSAYRHLGSYRGGSFKAWVLRMVTNACYDELRRRKRRPVIPLEPLNDTDEEIESPAWLASSDPSPEEVVHLKELDTAIDHCLSTLLPDFRSVVILVDVQNMEYEEVSSILKSPLGTIKSRLARARQKMRDCLQGFEELLPSEYRHEQEGK